MNPESPSLTPTAERLRARFPEAVLDLAMAVDVPTATLDPARLLEVARFLRDELGFNVPVLATGIDWQDRIEVVWHVLRMETGELLALKVALDRDEPRVASLTPVWRGMDWHEREAFDLLGVLFDDHPDLRRILLPDDWEGFPLRKDYTAID
jgi:NADH-quinone oxidoreductase subunit C